MSFPRMHDQPEVSLIVHHPRDVRRYMIQCQGGPDQRIHLLSGAPDPRRLGGVRTFAPDNRGRAAQRRVQMA